MNGRGSSPKEEGAEIEAPSSLLRGGGRSEDISHEHSLGSWGEKEGDFSYPGGCPSDTESPRGLPAQRAAGPWGTHPGAGVSSRGLWPLRPFIQALSPRSPPAGPGTGDKIAGGVREVRFTALRARGSPQEGRGLQASQGGVPVCLFERSSVQERQGPPL